MPGGVSFLKRLSASQIDLFTDCRRKWAYRYIAGIKAPPHPSAALGSRVHKVLEDWLTSSVLPDETTVEGSIARAGLHNLPPPYIAETEGKREFQTPGGTEWVGYVDAFFFERDGAPVAPTYALPTDTPVILDHKTTADFGYAKNADSLKTDPQAVLYAYDTLNTYPHPHVDLRWVYYRTKKNRPGSQVVSLRLTREHVDTQIEVIDTIAAEIHDIYRSGVNPADLPPNLDACNMYGGCPHRAICPISNEQKVDSIMAGNVKDLVRARLQQQAQASVAPPMPTAGIPGVPPPPPPATVPPPPPPASIPAPPDVLGAAAEYLQARGASPETVAIANAPLTFEQSRSFDEQINNGYGASINPPEAPPEVAAPEYLPIVEPIPGSGPETPPDDGLDAMDRDALKFLAVSRRLVGASSRLQKPSLIDLLRGALVQGAPADLAPPAVFREVFVSGGQPAAPVVVGAEPMQVSHTAGTVEIAPFAPTVRHLPDADLRDRLAMAALACTQTEHSPEGRAAYAYAIADAMLRVRG